MGKSLIIKGADFSANAIGRENPSIFINSTGVVTINAIGASNIYYTTDGSTPTASSSEYSQPFQAVSGMVIKTIAKYSDNTMSDVVSESVGDIIITWNKTRNGYIGQDGQVTEDDNYESMVIPMSNGVAYEAHQQYNANKLRIFSVSNGIYTAISYYQSSIYTYNCNNDNYVMQLVFDKTKIAEHPDYPYVKIVSQTE